ncbi:flagellar hook-basal body complex protein [Candidatus Paracaedibacter symbiosus]|uniref:flagellar hook-basal body complex protein n=1 Tax=Candidatus Paracaedibacter symbiosus TaxID=244582 RepID=UPI0005098501|nr:flagellar hook-basal body complex protein [Candidatus Paracaedibacter symbiosus]
MKNISCTNLARFLLLNKAEFLFGLKVTMSTIPNAPVHRAGTVMLSMQESLWPQLSGVADNMSNSKTKGFKRFITQTKSVDYTTPGKDTVSYANTRSSIDFSQGSLEETGNKFDLGISGAGFLTFRTQDKSTVYSRDGQLSLNSRGALVNNLGDTLLGDGGSEILIPATAKDIEFAEDGTISVDEKVIAKIGLTNFEDKSRLTFIGNGYFTTDVKGKPVDTPSIWQGFAEASNVNPINEALKLVEMARNFENAQKILEDDAKRQSKAINTSSTNNV